MRRFAFALLLPLVLGSSSALADYRITRDHGGLVDQYKTKYAMIRDRGERVIIDGICNSACTLVLGIVYWLLHEGRTVSAPSLPDLGSRYASPGGPGTDVVRVDVNRPPPRSGTIIGRFPVAAETSDNPFFKGPRTRMVVVSLALH